MIKKQSVLSIRQKKERGEKIVALTAYDFPTARILDRAGVDLLLVGDSLGMVVQGHANTLAVTVSEMIYHLRMVRRAVDRALLVADMPFGSYHESPRLAVRHAVRLVKRGGAEAVKVEGGGHRLSAIRALLEAEIPVMGHLGLTPQSVHRFGGFRIQGRNMAEIDSLLRDAAALEQAGCFALVLEGIPLEVARLLTERLAIPTIGIGSGPHCDGQILVTHDMLGWDPDSRLTFVRTYARMAELIESSVRQYAEDIRRSAFPSGEESFTLEPAVLEALRQKHGTHHQD